MELDLTRFWAENAASLHKPFRTDKPRAPVALAMDDHWLLDEMRVPSTVRYYREPDYRAQVNRSCNDRCEQSLGIRPFNQVPAATPPLRIEEVLGSHFELTEGGTPWLEPGIHSIDQLRGRLGELERLSDAGLFALMTSNGGTIVPRRPLDNGAKPTVSAGSRGPATIATSVLGTTQFLYWLIDYPADMDRFYDVLADLLIRYQRIIERESRATFRGYAWLDDNCCLLSPELYERFCLKVLKRVFEAFAPDPGDWRFQHSDSAMEHLLPILAPLGFHGVNFGPTILAATIRAHMPRAVVHGQVAPMTLRNQPREAVVEEVKRDFAAVGRDGGLLLTTAGSISAGTSLPSIRAFMQAADEHTRYDRPA